MVKKKHLIALFCATIITVACGEDKPVIPVKKEAPEQPTKPVVKTDEEWKKELTPEQYRILRQAGTEAPNGKAYKEFKAQGAGTYYCGGCGAELFSSKTKFDSRCGWPSFYDPSKAKNVKTDTDYHLGYARTEVRCAVCDGHLGHVFAGETFESFDGEETPTGQRYCINGVALTFVPEGGKAPEKKAPVKTEKAEDKKEKKTEK